jgi:pimeloyl-ACP methyl ester carboxylesterase
VRESHDVSAAVAFALDSLGFSRVILVATSVGASAGIIAAATHRNKGSPYYVSAVIAENPLTRPELLLQVCG